LSQADFDEPWEAEALALAMALIDTGRITKAEWAEALGAAIRQAQPDAGDDGSRYYNHVLDALERVAVDKSLTTGQALAGRKAAWRDAYVVTPHGQPVLLGARR
jgi:nitrile hydratase accessory protein